MEVIKIHVFLKLHAVLIDCQLVSWPHPCYSVRLTNLLKAARFCVAASFCLMHQKDKNSCLSGIHLNGKLINVVIFWRMLWLNELFPFFFSPRYLLLWCQEYLTKLGNTECHPEQFLKRRAALDKLLIIIQNEDIDNLIHKVLHISKCVPQKTTVKAQPEELTVSKATLLIFKQQSDQLPFQRNKIVVVSSPIRSHTHNYLYLHIVGDEYFWCILAINTFSQSLLSSVEAPVVLFLVLYCCNSK